MNYQTLVIIGHVDHGKTSLVKALTGIDTDRLPEEKERGISIALGFCNLQTDHGETAIIDAPGHERFIRTMIGGTTGATAALLVVDVREGVMAQTREHIDIAQLLGIQRGIIVLSKTDLADPDLIELAEAEISETVSDTFLQSAPIIRTSVESGDGIEHLKREIDALVANVRPPRTERHFYLPIDRVFSMKGHGTVVTGTLASAPLAIDQEVEILPGHTRATIREIQSHGTKQKSVDPGHRVAVNLRRQDKSELQRGHVLIAPGSLQEHSRFGVSIKLLASATEPLVQNKPIRILFGTTETFGHLRFFDQAELQPGQSALAELRLDAPAAPLLRNRFVIRTYSPMVTIGGGMFLDSWARDIKQPRSDLSARLTVLAQDDPTKMIEHFLSHEAAPPLNAEAFALKYRIDLNQLLVILTDLKAHPLGDNIFTTPERFEETKSSLLSEVDAFHAKHPNEPGVSRAALLSSHSTDLREPALTALLHAKELESVDGVIRKGGRDPESAFSPAQKTKLSQYINQTRAAGLNAPKLTELPGATGPDKTLYSFLISRGDLVAAPIPHKPPKPEHTLVFHSESLDSAVAQLKSALGPDARFSTSDAKEVLGISRKFLIPLLECLDSKGLTMRVGEERVIR